MIDYTVMYTVDFLFIINWSVHRLLLLTALTNHT